MSSPPLDGFDPVSSPPAPGQPTLAYVTAVRASGIAADPSEVPAPFAVWLALLPHADRAAFVPAYRAAAMAAEVAFDVGARAALRYAVQAFEKGADPFDALADAVAFYAPDLNGGAPRDRTAERDVPQAFRDDVAFARAFSGADER